MQHWLIKEEPGKYSFDDLMADGRTDWTGVRNYQARNNLRAMKKGDALLYYHSGKEKAVVGEARVTKTAYPDPTAAEGDWSCVEVEAVGPLANPVSIKQARVDAVLGESVLVKNSRLSVQPLTAAEYRRFVKLGE